mgnify:CR=1 FL=1
MTNSKSGIYQIRNLINDKKYIGSTNNFSNRFSSHKRFLRKNRHVNQHLQNAWNEHGEGNFEFEILEVVDVDNLLMIEQQYIDRYWSLNVLYNKNNIADKPPNRSGIKLTDKHKRNIGNAQKAIGNKPPGWFGKKRGQDYCQKMSVRFKEMNHLPPSRKGSTISKEHKEAISKASKKEVYQFSLDGDLIKKWNSILEALQALGKNIKSSSISECLSGRNKTAYGFIWKLEYEQHTQNNSW